MKIYGLDFTSRPTPKKPITCAVGQIENGKLSLTALDEFSDFASFETFLAADDEWIGGFDFPFGLPQIFLESMNWTASWGSYVEKIGQMSMDDRVELARNYSTSRPAGQKLPRRQTDQIKGGTSPVKVDYQPVGRMFFQGAPRLLKAGLNILPCHPTSARRTALEAYPGAMVKEIFGKKPKYKVEKASEDKPQYQAVRQQILQYAQSKAQVAPDILSQLQADFKGDRIDAVLCALQVWKAFPQSNYGIPDSANPLEGWIVG